MFDQPSFSDHVASVVTQSFTQLLVQAMIISHLCDCSAPLAGLLQMVKNATAHLVFNQPKRSHVILLLIDLHWLPSAATIKFKPLMLPSEWPQGLHHRLELSHSALCSFSSTVFLQGMSSGTVKTVPVQTVLVCGSLMVEQAIEVYHNMGVPLIFSPSNTCNTLTCLTNT